jgi:hypothetical protein
LLTDYVFEDERLIHYSTATMSILGLPLALLVLGWTRQYYRRAVADVQSWGA